MDSGLSKVSLLWMLGEADALQLDIDVAAVNRIGRGRQPSHEIRRYCEDDANGSIHPQPTGGWWAFEYAPKTVRLREAKERASFLGYYLPRAEPRLVAADALLHRSVLDRAGLGYKAVNLSEPLTSYGVEETLYL